MAVSSAMQHGGRPASAAFSQHDPSITWVLASLCALNQEVAQKQHSGGGPARAAPGTYLRCGE
jgi:hypothetical protein